jgi:hypothetical protein
MFSNRDKGWGGDDAGDGIGVGMTLETGVGVGFMVYKLILLDLIFIGTS